MECVNCSVENTATARFCVNCGMAMVRSKCQSCGEDLPVNARFCPACGAGASQGAGSTSHVRKDATQPGHTTRETRKQITVLFADVSGFTAMSEKMDAEEVRDTMNALWARLDEIVIRHGGMIDKHIGDAMMALFGAETALENDPERAVRAALLMRECLGQFGSEQKAPLKMRIGINTGMVMLGPVGSTREFTAMGDTVNLASRLEHHAPVSGILISHDTYRHLYGLFDVQALDPLTVKGKSEPVQVYLVERAKERSFSFRMRGIEGVETKMVGRELELKQLQEACRHATDERDVQIVTVVGEAGIGKSCLRDEFQKWLELLPDSVHLFKARSTSEMAGLPFALMRDAFTSRFAIQESDPKTVAKEKLEAGLVSFLAAGPKASSWTRTDLEMRAHFIGQLLGEDFSDSPHLQEILNDAGQIRSRAFHYLTEFFAAASVSSPVAGVKPVAAVLILEDIHWADDSSLDLVDHLSRTCAGSPLFVLCLSRPQLFERRPAWGEGIASQTRIALRALSKRESCALVESILRKATTVPAALRDLVVEGGEGNPFYIEELLKMLMDQKVILSHNEQWLIDVDRLATIQVPPTLTGVLQARLEGLSPAEQIALQRASVIGRIFWDTAVESLNASPTAATTAPLMLEQEIKTAFNLLRRKELIYRREVSAFASSTEYIFRHELLRHVTYETVLRKLRRIYHGQVAAWLIEQSGERANQFAGLIALHYEQAGQTVDAAVWYGRAGLQARAGYAPATAISYYEKALSLLPAEQTAQPEFQSHLMAWHDGLGETLCAQARFGEAIEPFRALLARAEALGDSLAQARAWNGLAFLQERQGDNRASVESADRAQELARQAGDAPEARAELIKALNLKGWAFYRLADAKAVLALGQQTLKLCQESGDHRGLVSSFKLHGVAHLQLAQYSQAEDYFTRGLELSRQLGDRRNLSAMFSNLGESARMRGDFKTAAELYQKALAVAQEIGHRESEIIYLSNLCGARLGLNEFVLAETDLRRVISLAGGTKSGALSEAHCFLAEACLGQEKLAEALDAATAALALGQESEGLLETACTLRVLGRVIAQIERKGLDVAIPKNDSSRRSPRACFEESLEIFRKIGATGEQTRTLTEWAAYETAHGGSHRAMELEQEARMLSSDLGKGISNENPRVTVQEG